ncbi:Dynein heavy chain 2 like protein [Argiope bruennichi]|uniref:Dynein heavy chain 2 like protein n=1 Tax=Argiope bruennichi TaxID=94029 RepID=A0A8T0F2G7_ARGBR|nr:Dynein heavy chain 2 like protein [Argiope bruennichi]
METTLNIPSVDLSLVRKYSLAELEEIDFSTSDDFAIVVENLKTVITLEKNIEEFWTEDHEQILWQFVIDPESNVLTVYFSGDALVVERDIPKAEIPELFYFIKVVPDKLISSDYSSKLLYGTAKAPFFESLYQTLCIVYFPMFSRSGEWSKCIKTDYLDHLSKFLLELFDLRNKLQKEIVFYVPDDIFDKDVRSVIDQKELLNQVERTVMKWIWLFTCVLMQGGNNNSEESGPLEEIEFWKLKCNDLKKVLYQLERDDVKMCIEILKAAKLTSYFKFMEVSNQLQNQFNIAQNNVKFLSILKTPCKDIETAALSEIPDHLSKLLDFVRIIWNNSPYLKDHSEISNLLCKVNNFVIKTVSNHIPLDEIFQDKTSVQKQNLLDVIAVCNKWIEIFEFSEKVHKKFAASVWSGQDLSPQINLFVHRCEELIQVCEYKDEFSCEENADIYSPGQKCYEIAEQLEAIQTSFWNFLHELGENKRAALHIRSAAWYEFFKTFKLQVNELEISISKLMLNAFENLNTIEEGLEILKMFQKHFKKQAMKRDLRRCVKTLYDIFLNELHHVQEKSVELKTLCHPSLPQYGGTAFCASLLPRRVKQLYKKLQDASKMWPRECDIDIKTFYERVIDSNNELIHTLFLQWTKTIPKDPYGWLKDPIFVKEEGTPFLKLNVSSEILILIQELYYWDKTGVEIPQQIVHLLEKGDVFHKRIMKMLESVQNYNRIIRSLSSEDKEIFADILATIEEGIKPVLSNLNWTVPPSTIKSSLKVISDQTKVARETFFLYDANKTKIEKQCGEIGRKSLFNTDITEPFDYAEFIRNQVSQIPAAFSEMFLSSVSSALTECLISSLKSVASLVGVNRDDKIRMIIKLSLHLRDHQMCFIPNIKELCLGFEKLMNEMEESLGELMVFEENLIGDVDAKEHFSEKVRNSKTVQELKQEIDFGLYLLYKAEKNYKSEWNSYSCLWETSKIDILKGYQERGWNALEFEGDINRFLEIGKNVLLIPRYTALEFCIVDCQYLKDAAVACAEEWKTELGSILSKIACSNLQNAFDLFELTSANQSMERFPLILKRFREDPYNLQQLKRCIHFLINMKKYSYEIQSTFKSIDLNFEVLTRIGTPVSEKSLDQRKNLYDMWEKLQNNFKNYYIKLQKIQAQHQRHFLSYHKQLERHPKKFWKKYTLEKGLSIKSTLRPSFISFPDLSHLRLAWSYIKQLDDYLEDWGNVPSIKEIQKTWESITFKMVDYKKFHKLEDSESIVSFVERNQITLGTMKSSKYVSYFSSIVDSLEDSLLLILDVIKQADYFQSKFFLLENIFAEQAVQAQLPKEANEVQQVTVMWRDISSLMDDEKLVWNICHKEGFLDRLIGMNKVLEEVQQSLEFYLDSKRRAFPRFYFLSNDDLLCIIGEKEPEAIQPHLKKCFDSIYQLKIVEKIEEKLRERIVTVMALGMYSAFDEFVEFKNSVTLDGPVESWLSDIEEMMQITLCTSLPKCLQTLNSIISKEDFNFSNVKWLNNWPTQISVLSILTTWTTEVTTAIKVVQETAVTTALKNLHKRWRDILNQFIIKLQNETEALMQTKTMMIILALVHSCEIIESLIAYVCNDPSAFEWLVHLRYYVEEESCFIRQTKSAFKYGFEYLGNRERLVITPVTSRCFLSLTTALYLNKGATLRGCRSSGKTETLKDLGITLGKYTLVINCSENLDHRSLVRMFSGLAQIGAWGLFEDYNCIKEEIISVLSQQINTVLIALAEKKRLFSFFGNDIPLNEGCGIFLSENPDFPSRTSEFSSSFRPVTIISPDVFTVIQVYLFAYGFKDPKAMATDIKLVFTMAKDQLSKHEHYEFGLKTITTFLKHVGKQKRANPKLADLEVIVSCLRNTTIPKLESSDIHIFESLLETVFGTVKAMSEDFSKITEGIKRVLLKRSLQPESSIIKKVNELHEIKDYYHGIILVGESGSGKSTSWETLKETYFYLHEINDTEYQSVNVYSFNSKAYTLSELYGYFSGDGIWVDGLFSSVLKEANQDARAGERWIVLNGPVDATWIESINSLLDINKVLTTANGERILLSSEVLLIFETTNLTHCSPNIMSHCGIIYHDISTVNWKMYALSWLQSLESSIMRKTLENFFDQYLDAIFDYSSKSLKSIPNVTALNKISSFIRILDAYYKKILSDKIETEKLSRIFWMSVIWSIGAMLDRQDRFSFDTLIKGLDESLEHLPSVFDYGLDESFEWIRWTSHPNNKLKFHPGQHFANVLIPTAATISYQSITELLLGEARPVLLIGTNGCGKTIIGTNLLYEIEKKDYLSSIINFSPQVSSFLLQQILERQLNKKAGGLLLPQFGKKMVVFLDDIDEGKTDEFGSQSSLELLYMILDGAFWYNRDKWILNHLQNISFLASARSPCSYQNKIPAQLLNRFSIINVLAPQESQMKHIFISLLKQKFSDSNIEIRRTLNAITLGCTAIYKSMKNFFLPVSSKLHYVFGLKDVKKVLYRILDINPEMLHDKIALTKFWFHECTREFSDRFINAGEKEEFFNILEDVTDKEFLIKMKDHYKEPEKLKFIKSEGDDKGYDEMHDPAFLKYYFENQIDEIRKTEESFSDAFVLFEDNINHLCRIMRGIENSYGNMLLLGATGTGKRSLSRLAAFILKYEVFEMNLEVSYGLPEFKKDLRDILYDTGIKNKKIVFLLSDDQIIDDIFLHFLSDILTVSVPFDVFTSHELKSMCSEISGSSGSHRDFVQNIQQNLHIILCVNYSSPLYRTCFLKYPALYKNCTIDWFNKWPQEALETIALKFLQDVDLKPTNEERLGTCCKFLSEMHISALKHSQSSSSVYGISFETSSTFIKLTNTFKKVLAKRQRIVEQALKRLTSGLEKIHETQEKVNEIARETKQAQEELKIAEEECDEALKDIILKKEILAEKQESIQEKKIEIEKKERVCKRIAIAAEEDLNAALPALEEARKALEALNKRDIGEIKSYAKPPVLVEIVLEAVMILRNSEPSWAEAKRQLGSPSFLKELFEYDRDNISDAALAKIGKYVKNPQFQPDIVGKVSLAAKSLCIWVRAMHVYGEIYKKVKPKMERLRIAKEELERLQKTLAELLRELEELEASIRRLEEEHKRLIEKKEELARKAMELALKLKRAESIIEGLSSEKERWQNKVLILSEKRNFVVGDSFLASGYLTYLGPHDQSHRTFLGKRWKRKISETMFTCSSVFDLADFFVEEGIKNEWKMNGLPTDQYSNEGAAIVTESCYYPFIVDPEGQALKWIKNMETKRKIKLVDFQDSKWALALEAAITQGYPILLQNVNPGLNSSLSTLLKQSFNKHFIHFNNKKLKIGDSFQLYMLTMTLNPQFTSNAIYLTTIVNFTIKEKGLEDQLLPLIVLNERSDLEMRKEKLVKTIQDCKKQLLEIEDTVLKLLSTSTGSLLDDEVLVEALQKSKTVSIEVEEKLSSSEKTETIIDSARDIMNILNSEGIIASQNIRPCAKMASILYFVLTDMAHVDPMYVFTLDSYITLFLNSISKSPRDPEVTRRILKLNAFHQRAVYRFACRTVIEKHALLLAFHICTKILLVEGKLEKPEYDFFIKGGQVIDRTSEPANPCSQWLSQESWDHITQLERLPRFLSITVSFDENSRLWQEWYLTLEPEKKALPGIWRNVCSGFQMLLIIRCLRLDRLTNCVTSLIYNNLGKSFLEYPDIEMGEIFDESSPNKPLVLFTVSSDTNPEKIIENLAKSLEIKYRAISLGKGQENAASQLIIDSAKVGYWVFISNCHLLLNWLPALEKFVNKLQSIKVHEKFRLWLGSAPTKHFPTSVLQNSIIISLDFPKGIRANMLKLYEDTITEEDISTSTCQTKYKSLLFSMSFFHSILLERRRFQNLGWNFNYNFTKEDFKASSILLKLYLDEYKDTQWNALKTMIAESIYGGHIADVNDERLLMFYFDQFLCDEVCANIKHRLTSVSDYYVPEDGPLEIYVRFIEGLPSLDVPEVFGQHCNAEIPYRVEDAKEILDNMMKIKGEPFAVKSNESQLTKVISDVKLRIPDLLDEMGALDILQERPDSYNEILVQETKRYNNLLNLVSNSLNELEDSIFGQVMMTDELEELSKVILKMEVPEEWQKLYPTLKPLGSWIQDLRLRVEQFAKWISLGVMPVKIWLSGFSSPNSVLNATLQTTVKNSDVMLKELIWEYQVSTLEESHIIEVPAEGIYVRGLLLEGAGWDKTNGILIEPEPLHLITTMPVIHFKPVTETSVRGVYNCPCYYTSKKTNEKGYTSFLFNVDLKTKKAKDYWVKRGTSLLLSSK